VQVKKTEVMAIGMAVPQNYKSQRQNKEATKIDITMGDAADQQIYGMGDNLMWKDY
jgi:hypothetical protein